MAPAPAPLASENEAPAPLKNPSSSSGFPALIIILLSMVSVFCLLVRGG